MAVAAVGMSGAHAHLVNFKSALKRNRLFILLLIGISASLSLLWWRQSHRMVAPPSMQVLAQGAETSTLIAGRAGAGPRIDSRIDPAITTRIMHGRKAFEIHSAPPEYEGSARDFVRSLLPAAEQGDGAAAYRIWLRIHDCKPALSEISDIALANMAKVGLAGSMLASRELAQQQCADLIADHALWRRPWLALAAGNGSLEARLMYAVSPEAALGEGFEPLAHPEVVAAYRERAMAYLHDEASLGSIDALVSLSLAYQNGVLTARDEVAAYAYDIVIDRVYPLSFRPPDLVERATSLSAEEVRRSRNMAEHIHSNCCR